MIFKKQLIILLIIVILPLIFADTEINSVIVPLAINGTEGELDVSLDQITFPETEQEETQDVAIDFSSFDQNASFSVNDPVNYKRLNISHYFLKSELNTKKRIYSFNQGRTYVINNSLEEASKDKSLELKLSLSDSTEEIYLIIDSFQSNQIPLMTQFVAVSSSTIEVNASIKYLKINKEIIRENKIQLNLDSNLENISLQIIELDNNQKVSGIYSTNILQLNYENFNKYTLFQINKNLIEFYCPYCRIKDYGVNENGFSSCGVSIFEEEKKPISEYLSKKENICLSPDGSRIQGFTNESLKLFGFDRLYFEWNNNIPSDLFDYGQYYIDQDQFRIAVSKKLDSISNNDYVEIGTTKYRKGKNNLISKVSTYLEYDLSDFSELSTNTSINESLDFSIAVLNSIPEEYQKLTILDLVNNEPAVSDLEFERIMQEILSSNYYKARDYHTHYQITLEEYISSFDNFKTSRTNSDIYSKLLYGLAQKTSGYSNVYFSEGLNYFIYNLKPFDSNEETQEIFGNKNTEFLGNYWNLNLVFDQEINQPKTVVVNLSDVVLDKKEAVVNLESPNKNLFVNYYLTNQYYSYNLLFLKSINALSYNRGDFFENTVSVNSKMPEVVRNYENLQDGKIISFDLTNPYFLINLTGPVIITKNFEEDVVIRYYDGREYVNYSKDLIKTYNSIEDFPTKETIVIYPIQTLNIEYPIIIESQTPLIFNIEVVSDYQEEKYIYKLFLRNYSLKLSDLINNISKSKTCFSVSEDKLSLWQNIDKELNISKTNSFIEFTEALESQENQLGDNLVQNQNEQVTTDFAVYTVDESKDLYKQIQTVNSFIQTEIDFKNLEVLGKYSAVYEEILKTEPDLKKEFVNLLSCNETLICSVLITKYIPQGSFFERFKTSCVANTPTECVSFWSNPRTNFCSAFVRNFNNSYFGYRLDSANAWDLAKQPNNKSIWKAINGTLPESSYDYLIPGSVLGIKHNNTSYWDKEYSHVVVYLGKIGSHHYIVHTWGNTLKIEKLDVFLKTTARGKNAYGYYEDGLIKEILISNNLNQKLKTTAKEKGIFLGNADTSIYQGIIPDYILDSFNTYEMISTTQRSNLDQLMYQELETVYNNILNKNFNIYYKINYINPSNQEISENIKLFPEKPMIIVLGKYKKLFLVNKENGITNIISEYPIATGINGFGCQNDSLKTPTGLFRIVQKVGQACLPLQVLGPNGCEYNNNLPVIATYNSGTAKVVIRKLVLDGLEKGHLGLGCEQGNRNTIYRGIYIHGTNYENSMGKQLSHGCIRMLNDEIITLFDNVQNGTYVYIYNSETSYSSLLDLENRLTNSGNNLEFTLTGARRPPIRNNPILTRPVIKTMNDLDNYIDNRISKFRMLNNTTNVSLNYANNCSTVTLRFPCFLKEALNVEYDAHVINPQSSEFNEIVFKVTKAFNYTLEETAQFWGSVAQESGTSTNINGRESRFGTSLAGKPAYGVAQIEREPWRQYEANKYTFDLMIPDFNSVNLFNVIQEDSRIGNVTKLTGNSNTIDSRREIIALLDLIWTNQSKYASVVFSAGLKRYLGGQLIKNSQQRYNSGRITEPFWQSHRIIYDHDNSINFNAAIIYFYKYTGIPNEMFNGIRRYSNLNGGSDTIKTMALKLANYLAFKKEYYMYYHKMVDETHSDLLTSMKNARVIN